jgi:hypothetical protein
MVGEDRHTMNEFSLDISLLKDWREFNTANRQMTYPFGAHLIISDLTSLEGKDIHKSTSTGSNSIGEEYDKEHHSPTCQYCYWD